MQRAPKGTRTRQRTHVVAVVALAAGNIVPADGRIVRSATLGAVFLAVTGAEALYADLGHFGRKPIQNAWLFLVLPALARLETVS